MRRPWIAVGLIALIVGFAAGYRVAHRGRTQATAAPPSREAEAPGPPPRPVERPASPPSAEDAKDAVAVKAADGRVAPQRSIGAEGSASAVPRAAVPSSAVTTQAEADRVSSFTPRGDQAAPQVVAPPAVASPVIAPPAVAPRDVAPPVPRSAYSAGATDPETTNPAKVDTTPVVPGDPESDRRPPTVEFVRFDPPEIQDGGAAILSIGTADDLSGVKSVVGTIRSPSEAGTVPFLADDAAGNGVFTARIAIPRQAETGDWFVGTLQLVDKADNPLSLAFGKATAPPGGVLRVVSSESDSTPPAVHRITVDKGTINGGEKNQVVIDVDDDRSGVAYVNGWFRSPAKSALIYFSCAARGDGTWAGDVAIPVNADCGEWALWQLKVTDKAQNFAVLVNDAPEVGHVSFTVSGGGGCDPDPPVLDALSVSPMVVSNGTAAQVVLTVTSHDDGSGVATLNGSIEGPVPPVGEVPKIFFSAQSDPNHADAPTLVTIVVPQHAAAGIWRVGVIRLTDKSGNMHAYEWGDPVLANAYFTVE